MNPGEILPFSLSGKKKGPTIKHKKPSRYKISWYTA